MSMEQSVFGRLPDGAPVELFTLKNTAGMTAQIMSYGCRVVRLTVPDRNGNPGDVVLGHDAFAEYREPGDVFGAVVGRFANRIGGAVFTVDGQEYPLAANDGNNALHSAPGGFQDKLWRLTECGGGEAPFVTLAYHSPDGECGFPGNADITVRYTLTPDNALFITYAAETDHETPLNLTNHSYFNLSGDLNEDILSHELQLSADYITAVGADLIPTGALVPVEGTPYDFRQPKALGRDIGANDTLLKSCGGYDHNFVLSGSAGIKRAGEVYDPKSGRVMEIITDMPGVQLYTANSFSVNGMGKGGIRHLPHHAFCLETQFFPDSVHHAEFPYENLKPGRPFRSATIYRFSVK